MAGIRALTPEHVARASLAEQKADSALELVESRNAAIASKAQGTLKDKKYNEIKAENMEIIADYRTKTTHTKEEELAHMKALDWMDQHYALVAAGNPANFNTKSDMSKYLPQQAAPVMNNPYRQPQNQERTDSGTKSGSGTVIKYDSKGNRVQ